MSRLEVQKKMDLLDLEDSDTESEFGTSFLESLVEKIQNTGFESDTESDEGSEFSIAIEKPKPYISDENEQDHYYCQLCKYTTPKTYRWQQHLLTKKHLKQTGQLPQEPSEYECKGCKYVTKHKGNYMKHLKTATHREFVPYEKKIKVVVKRKFE